MNSRTPSSKTDVVAEASAWFIEFRAGEVAAGDRARYYEWLQRSPEHIQAYLEIAEGWSELPTSDSNANFDIDALVARAAQSDDDNIIPLAPRAETRAPKSTATRFAWAASVAILAVLAGAAAWLWSYEANTFRTDISEQRMVKLADGSMLELNALSTVRIRFSEETRDIDLVQGQALFHVAKDAARPFIVRSGETLVRAVGTQFDVHRKSTGTVVTVLEGRVAVVGGEGARVDTQSGSLSDGAMSPPGVLLVAGEQVTVPAVAEVELDLQPKRADVSAATAWVRKQLVFNETPLSEVAEEFNRYSARRLVIADPELRALAVSGVYSATQPESLLGFLRAQPNIRLSETEQEVRVTLASH